MDAVIEPRRSITASVSTARKGRAEPPDSSAIGRTSRSMGPCSWRSGVGKMALSTEVAGGCGREVRRAMGVTPNITRTYGLQRGLQRSLEPSEKAAGRPEALHRATSSDYPRKFFYFAQAPGFFSRAASNMAERVMLLAIG
jgi:hypothetical protein